jgi:hypothetical protein
MNRALMNVAAMAVIGGIAASDYEISDLEDIGDRPKKAKGKRYAPIVEARQKPKDKSKSLKRLLRNKGRR